MDFKTIGKHLISLGLPVLGTAIGGPAGGVVAQMLADKLGGVPARMSADDPQGMLDRLIGDAEAIRKAREFEMTHAATLRQLHLDALKKSDEGQVELIKGDQQKTFYDRGWRPGAAWICVFGLFFTFGLRPLLPWMLTVAGVDGVPPLPAIDTSELFVMLGGLLGLGTMRHIERVKGKA